MITLTTNNFIDNLIDIKKIEYDKTYNKISKLHKYWSRKPWYIIEKYILKYTQENDLVIDPFCGSGTIGLESILNSRRFIGYDLNPAATFLTENLLKFDFSPTIFNKELTRLEQDLKKQLMSLYLIDTENDRFVRYNIIGPINKSNYNCVIFDYNFNNVQKINRDGDVLRLTLDNPQNKDCPDKDFPLKFYKDRFSYKGVKKVSDMYTPRNLKALTILYDYIMNSNFFYKDLFLLAFTNTLLHVSKLKAENVRPLSVNNYWIPDDYIEENVYWRFYDRIKNIKIAKEVINKRIQEKDITPNPNFKVINKTSIELSELANQSVDYIITDPPYGDGIQYSELSYIWNCWLKKDFYIEDEVIINPVQNKGFKEYIENMLKFIINVKRVLKPYRFFTLCFQNKEVKIWLGLIELIQKYGFELENIEIYDTFGSPYNKYWASFSPKADIYVTFKNSNKKYKEPINEIKSIDIVKNIITYLKEKNGSIFNLNKGYDLFVATVIQEIFNNKSISDAKGLDVKKIIKLFEREVNDGNL